MAFSPRQEQTQPKSMSIAMKSIPQLLTPEEHAADSFSISKPLPSFQTAVPSPPASPEFNSFNTESHFRSNDDILYPDHTHVQSKPSERPLFDEESRWDVQQRQPTPATERSLSISTPSGSPEQSVARPLKENFEKPSYEHPRVVQEQEPIGPVQLYNTYGLDYYRYMLSQSEDHRKRRQEARQLPPPKDTKAAQRDEYTRRVLASIGQSYRVSKAKATAQAQPQPKPKTSRPLSSRASVKPESLPAPVNESPSPIKRSRRQPSTSDAAFGTLPHIAQPKPRTRAAPSKKIDGEDEQWYNIPDCTPPLSYLDEPDVKLAAQWNNGNTLNLDNDPNREHLHPQELDVAAVLRLPCNKYLANKRRVFNERLKSLKEGRDFNKTSAQNVTKIDVNKASRLWQAFDNIGWFDEKWFQEHLKNGA
ncbi:SWIRM domain-containing protein [Fulvia fulva]|uniref:SWIRM domain-containing protein n=1 Tax=Passalora fulva TaxID=5499 RepID=A0A9Q8L9Y9_PASFU|nr:SWIRM domain-containing protein [Fulvia fulva]KAK4631166.1 SWIRM domain-containing protein [Fulvia fulva]KAK4633998.1 SWIRM domain-containing protein [Fulvia fulva]UJO13434.1 SWIRM domain-containing protein [Fulvia fulva]WPV11402.1 SWIRM domain-containing protein [Fulvia fulva]WPV25666.1 SWIRM domain-containing protein [Fulvia fulva]